MIIEIFKYLTNPATASAKKMGQLQETIAMEARYQRAKKQWQSHLENSKEIIKAASLNLDNNSEIIILGSGLLLDIPIDFLSKKFNHIYLIDVVHLKKTRNRVKKYQNVSLIEHDITGVSDTMLLAHENNEPYSLNHSPSLKIPALSPDTGLVISANMLSQLHLAPVYFAEKNFNLDEGQLNILASNIMKSHITLLNNSPCPVCLLTDHNRIYKNKTGHVISGENVLFDINLPTPDQTWYWEIAPHGELDKKTSMTSFVYAYKNFNRQ